jgi:hypothetical protein
MAEDRNSPADGRGEAGVQCSDGVGSIEAGYPIELEDPKGGEMAEWPLDLKVREWRGSAV